MSVLKQAEAVLEPIAPQRERYLTHTDTLMMVVLDCYDGPAEQPDPPHHHPHEQITYVAAGEVIFFMDGVPHKLSTGDMVAVAGNIPHCIQPLTPHVRLVDTFHPIREEFLKK